MTFETVVWVGGSSLLYGSQVKGVVSNSMLLIEELFPFSILANAPWKYSHFPELSQFKFILTQQYDILGSISACYGWAFRDENQLEADDSRAKLRQLSNPCSILSQISPHNYKFLFSLWASNIQTWLQRQQIVKSSQLINKNNGFMIKCYLWSKSKPNSRPNGVNIGELAASINVDVF